MASNSGAGSGSGRASGSNKGKTETVDRIWNALARVYDPELRKPITELGMVDAVEVGSESIRIQLLFTVAACPASDEIVKRVEQAAAPLACGRPVHVKRAAMTKQQRLDLMKKLRGPLPQQRSFTGNPRIIAVTSGKGGVGKSSIAALIALSTAQEGQRVALIDADVYGFSIPAIFGFNTHPDRFKLHKDRNMIAPAQVSGVQLISIGMLLPATSEPTTTPVAWRGPMLHRTLEQFFCQVGFGQLDLLVIDMPPGTGDIALSLGQLVPDAEALIVSTAQHTSATVAARSGVLAHSFGQRVLGVVENMSYLTLPPVLNTNENTGHAPSPIELFGSGGADAVSSILTQHLETPVPVLARIPFSPTFARLCEQGSPEDFFAQPDPAVAEIHALTKKLLSP